MLSETVAWLLQSHFGVVGLAPSCLILASMPGRNMHADDEGLLNKDSDGVSQSLATF